MRAKAPAPAPPELQYLTSCNKFVTIDPIRPRSNAQRNFPRHNPGSNLRSLFHVLSTHATAREASAGTDLPQPRCRHASHAYGGRLVEGSGLRVWLDGAEIELARGGDVRGVHEQVRVAQRGAALDPQWRSRVPTPGNDPGRLSEKVLPLGIGLTHGLLAGSKKSLTL